METIYACEAGWYNDDGMVMWYTLHRTIEGAKAEIIKDAALYVSLEDHPVKWWKEDHSGREYIHGSVEVADMKDTRGYSIYKIEVTE